MRTEEIVRAELTALRQTRHEKGDSIAEKESREIGDKAKALMAELSDVLSEGAQPCPECKAKPHGNHKQVERFKAQASGILVQEVPDVYVVRCLECKPIRDVESEVDNGDGTKKVTTKITLPAAKGETAAAAVAAWNAGVRSSTREIETVPV